MDSRGVPIGTPLSYRGRQTHSYAQSPRASSSSHMNPRMRVSFEELVVQNEALANANEGMRDALEAANSELAVRAMICVIARLG